MILRLLALLAATLAGVVASPASAQRPGALVSAAPAGDAPAGMRAWRIAYRTATQDGSPLQVTGVVIAPNGVPARPRRVIAWTHGTWGVVDKCTLSRRPAFFASTPALAEMIRRGYVVVAPDYPGFGSEISHGYLVGRETAYSVLDAVRAAQAVQGAAAGREFAVWGESQGGHAALWAASEARRYAPELALVGTAAAAPPTDLVANLRLGSDANIRAFLTSFVAYSWSRRFDAPTASLFTRATQGVATRLAQNNCVELGKTAGLGTILGLAAVRRALRGKDIGGIEPWAGIARANSVAAEQLPGPLLIAQSEKDPVVAPAVTLAFARSWCARRKPLRYLRLPGGDHAHSARDSSAATLDWIDARFAGAREPDDCGSL